MQTLNAYLKKLVRLTLITALVAALWPMEPAVAQASVTQWGLWERTLTTPQTHHWQTFPVQATFTHSSGQILSVDGFYNGTDAGGQQVWVVRFTPTLPGTWSWSTSSADANLRASGALQAVAPTPAQIAANPNLRGHLRVANSGPRANRYFTYADGTPFFWLGDTIWDFNSLRAGLGAPSEFANQNLAQWILDRKQKGFTVALAQFFWIAGRNEGGYPFPNNASVAGNGDFSNLNADHFQALDTRVSALHDNGFVIAIHPSWLSEFRMTVEDSSLLSRYLLARYGGYNLVWSLTGEYQEKYPSTNVWDDSPWALCWNYGSNVPNANCEWNQLGRAVDAYNAYDHPVSIHPGSRYGPWDTPPPAWGANANLQSSSGEFHTQSWLDHNWLQTGQFLENLFYVHQRTEADYARTPVKPAIHSEGFYENEKEEGASPADIRWQAWTAWLNGAAGHVYGAGGLYQFYDPTAPSNTHVPYEQTPWNAALGYPGSGYLRNVRDFMTAMDWWKFEPRRDWLRVNGSPVSAPTANDITPPHAAAIPNQIVVVYIPRGNGGNTITIANLGSGPYVVQAFDPRLGSFAPLNNGNPITPSNGSWTIPASVFADNEDWVVRLTAGATLPTPPTGPAFNVKINFQPSGSPVPSGYFADTGAAYANRGNGLSYGWNADNSANARNRDDARSPDERYDSFNHTQLGGNFVWELGVPNGLYTVRLVAGEATTYNSLFKFNIEGTLVVNGVPTDHVRWIEGSAQVTVSDGRLTVSNAPGASLNKLAFIEISQVP